MQQHATSFRRIVVTVAMAGALALAGCSVQPLYATGPAGTTLQAELAAISIVPVDDRVGQIIRNELIFDFTGGGAPAAPRYELTIATTVGRGAFDVIAPRDERMTSVAVTATYVLADIGTGAVITQGTARSETRFALSNQEFANVRAEEEARERAALEVAEEIRLGVAGALAAR